MIDRASPSAAAAEPVYVEETGPLGQVLPPMSVQTIRLATQVSSLSVM
jgi:hypothetical protein